MMRMARGRVSQAGITSSRGHSTSQYQRHEGGVMPTKSVYDSGEKVDGDTETVQSLSGV